MPSSLVSLLNTSARTWLQVAARIALMTWAAGLWTSGAWAETGSRVVAGIGLEFNQALRRLTDAVDAADAAGTGDAAEAAQRVLLPDQNTARQMPAPRLIVYELTFSRSDLTAAMGHTPAMVGIYLDRACDKVEVLLNDTLIHKSPYRDLHILKDCYMPQLLALPAKALAPQDNRLEIRLRGEPLKRVGSVRRAAGLGLVTVGDHDRLRLRHDREMLLGMHMPEISNAALALLGLLTLSLIARRPGQQQLLYFALAALSWAALSARGWWGIPVQDPQIREGFFTLVTALAGFSFPRFLARHGDLKLPLLDRIGLLQLLAAPAAVVAVGDDGIFVVSSAYSLIAAGLVTSSAAIYGYQALGSARRAMQAVAAVLLLGAALVLLELAAGLGWVQASPQLPLRWGIPCALMIIGALQLLELGRQANQLETHQHLLEREIAKARTEIEAHVQKLADARIEQVTLAERRRIAADLHDDLGAKLLTIVHTSANQRISNLGRDALDEMRLSVRGLVGKPLRLREALASWRNEGMMRLSHSGVEVTWAHSSEDPAYTLGARTAVQTTRVLREVINNIIKHSQASHCTVITRVNPPWLEFELRDNGHGFSLDAVPAEGDGIGLINIRQRVSQMGGQCIIDSMPGAGARIFFAVPVDQVVPAAEP